MATMTQDWNKLFLDWMQEIIDKASNSSNLNMENVRHTWQRAHKSLQSCPKQFSHPKELMQLKFIGPAICGKLERRMEKYCSDTGILRPVPASEPAAPEKRGRKRKAATDPTPLSATDPEATAAPAPPKKKRAWVPRYRSGGYAILLTLYHHDSVHPGVGMNKASITSLASDLCDAPFKSNPNVKAFYSAWNSIQTLIKHEVVYSSNSRNGMYYITDEGKALAEKVLQAERETKRQMSNGNHPSTPLTAQRPATISVIPVRPELSPIHRRLSGTMDTEVSPNTAVRNKIVEMAPSILHPTTSPLRAANNSSAAVSQVSGTQCETWPAGSYTISIIIDNREVRNSDDRNFFRDELERLGVTPRIEALSVGDAVWIAQHNTTKKVAVIDYILERKRVDDLISSIKDGRFTEQKSRLRRSGLTNVIYLIEEPQGIHKGPYQQHVQTAMSQAITIDGFHLKRTTTAEESAQFFAKLTKFLRKELYRDKELKVLWPQLTTSKAYLETMTHERQRLSASENYRLAVDFDTFQTALAKSSMLTVRDIYIRMLMTIKGVTLDKAMCIQGVWPTPKLLIDNYKRLVQEESRKSMVSDRLGNSITRKKVSRQLSEKIYEVWGKL